VFVAADGREAVEIYKNNIKIFLLFSPIWIAKLSGIDVYAMLKEMNPAVAVILRAASSHLNKIRTPQRRRQGIHSETIQLNEVLEL